MSDVAVQLQEFARFVVLTNERVRAQDFLLILRRNNVRVRVLGRGSCRVVDSVDHAVERIEGASVMEARSEDMVKVRLYARMCGIQSFILQEDGR